MIEDLEEREDNRIDFRGKSVSVMLECGNKNLCIDGIFLAENKEHFIVKDSKNKVVFICKNKIISHKFEESKSSFGYY